MSGAAGESSFGYGGDPYAGASWWERADVSEQTKYEVRERQRQLERERTADW